MSSNRRSAFTLIEILIVVVIMAVLAATIIPQFTDSQKDARQSTAQFNLNTLRAQIELFKAQHAGVLPGGTNLVDLTTVTTSNGKQYGPYMLQIPQNPVSGSSAVKTSSNSPIAIGDITTGTGGGWVYNPTTGEIRIDSTDLWTN